MVSFLYLDIFHNVDPHNVLTCIINIIDNKHNKLTLELVPVVLITLCDSMSTQDFVLADSLIFLLITWFNRICKSTQSPTAPVCRFSFLSVFQKLNLLSFWFKVCDHFEPVNKGMPKWVCVHKCKKGGSLAKHLPPRLLSPSPLVPCTCTHKQHTFIQAKPLSQNTFLSVLSLGFVFVVQIKKQSLPPMARDFFKKKLKK